MAALELVSQYSQTSPCKHLIAESSLEVTKTQKLKHTLPLCRRHLRSLTQTLYCVCDTDTAPLVCALNKFGQI